VRILSYCSTTCSAGTEIKFLVPETMLQNIEFVKTTFDEDESFEIYTTEETGNYFIDGILRDIVATPELVPDTLGFTSYTRSSNKVSENLEILIGLELINNSIPDDGLLTIEFPENFISKYNTEPQVICQNKGTSTTLSCTLEYYTDSKMVKKLTLTDLCPSSTSCDMQLAPSISLQMNNLENPPASFTVEGLITFTTLTSSSYEIDTITYSVSELGPLEAAEINAIHALPQNPTKGIASPYLFTFYIANLIPAPVHLLIVIPEGFSFAAPSRRGLQDIVCESVLGASEGLSCTASEGEQNTVEVDGLFEEDYVDGMFAIRVSDLVNSSALGESASFEFYLSALYEDQTLVIGQLIAGISIEILQEVSDCSENCATCAGTADFCTSCVLPSDNQILMNNICQTECDDGYFLYENTCLRCFDEKCLSCESYKKTSCTECVETEIVELEDGGTEELTYYRNNGECVSECPTGTIVVSEECLLEDQSNCDESCKTCSQNSDYCLSCEETSIYLKGEGECVSSCNSDQFVLNGVCESCYYECTSCSASATACLACDPLFNRFLDGTDPVCLSECPQGYFGSVEDAQTCQECHSDCYSCDGKYSDNCTSCHKDSSYRFLFLHDSQCALTCPKNYNYLYPEHECQLIEGPVFFNLTVIIILFLIAILILLIIITAIICKCDGRYFSVIFILHAILPIIEYIQRWLFSWYLWNGSNPYLFTLAFTCTVGSMLTSIMYYECFFWPMLNLKQFFLHYKNTYKKTIRFVSILARIVDLNVFRLVASGFLKIQGLSLPFREHHFFRRPIRSMSNINHYVITTLQVLVCILVILLIFEEADAYGHAILSLGITLFLVLLQLYDSFIVNKYFQLHYEKLSEKDTSQPNELSETPNEEEKKEELKNDVDEEEPNENELKEEEKIGEKPEEDMNEEVKENEENLNEKEEEKKENAEANDEILERHDEFVIEDLA
jgi:hypothetical protein